MPQWTPIAPASASAGSLRLGLCAVALLIGCATDFEVVPLDDTPMGIPPRVEPLPFTVGVGVRSFDVERIDELAFLEEFVERLKEARLFQGVIYPIPEGFDPAWELSLLLRERSSEPDSNFWKSALVNFVPSSINPFAQYVYFESEYELEIEALLTLAREVVASYPARAHVRYRYQRDTNRQLAELQGVQTIVDRSTRQLFTQLGADAERLREEDRTRASR